MSFAAQTLGAPRITVGIPRSRPAEKAPSADPFAAVIQPSEEATTLLRRADEGIERQDWKLAVDSLQRIVELPGEHVLSSDGQLYESAHRQALRRIAALPEAGLAVYRLVYDGEAEALLKRGLEEHDLRLLQTVVDRYLCTRPGERAALALADYLIDEGRFSESIGVLQQFQKTFPDPQLPRWVLPARLAISVASLGQKHRAEALLRRATSQPGATQAAAEEKLREVAVYVAAATPGKREADSVSWTMALGNPARDGRLQAVEPSFIEYEPWSLALTTSEPRNGIDAVRAYARRQRLLPARQMVTDGRTLVVKSDHELLALDPDSFAPLWTSGHGVQQEVLSEASPIPSFPTGEQGPTEAADAEMRDDPVVIGMLHDTVSGGVTLAYGLALTVEWPQRAPPVLTPSLLRQFPGGIPGREPFATGMGNEIHAYSVEDGRLVWKSDATAGRRTPAGDARRIRWRPATPFPTPETAEEGAVEFLAAPVPAGDYLIAPCRINSDLCAAVLDPKSGKLVREVYLCGTGGGSFDSLYALQPCVADGAVFIPTGRGLLIVMQVSDWSVRWAARYERLGGSAVASWLSTPVIAVADTVLLATQDSPFLFCFDRSSGELRWRTLIERGQTILGADDRQVWVSGKAVQMLDLESGEPVWSAAVDSDVTGRGVIAGDRVYLPTVDGVLAFNATSGEKVAVDAPAVEPPVLGNLLAWDGALYSVSGTQVRKYADLGQGYAQAVARHAENPADPSRAIRLACLELLKHEPDKALKALARVPVSSGDAALPASSSREAAAIEQVVHLRVRAILDMVPELPPNEALQRLQEARQMARTPADAIQSALLLGDYRARHGELLAGCLQYLSLVLSPAGDELVPCGGGLQQRARGLAAEKLALAAKGLNPAEAAQVEAAMAKSYEELTARGESAALWLAECPVIGEPAARAELVLGVEAARDLRIEQAESYLLRALRHARSPELTAEATARLASLYLEPEELHQPVSAAALLDRLGHELAGVMLPREALQPVAAERPADALAAVQPNLAGMVSGAQAAAMLRSRIDAERLATHREAMQPATLNAVGKATARSFPAARPLHMRMPRTEPLTDVLLLLADGNRVEARDLDSAKLLWPAELRLLGDIAVEPQLVEPQGNVAAMRSDMMGRARGVVSGQTLVLNTEYGIHAVGMRTGVRLWARRFDPPGAAAGSDAAIWTDDGYLVSVDARHHIEATFIAQGDRLLWRLTRPERDWASVRARGGFVVAADRKLEQVDIMRLVDGRGTGQCRFVQPESVESQVNLTLYDEVICGPASKREVVAYDLAAPGVERWRLPLTEEVGQLFKPDPNLLAIADRSGGLQIVDPGSGKKLVETRVEAFAAGIVDGAIVDGIAYVWGYQSRNPDPNRSDTQVWALAAVRMQDGKVSWQKANLGTRVYLSEELMRCSSNAIPVVAFALPGPTVFRGDPVRLQNTSAVVRLLNKASGEWIGDQVTAALPGDGEGSRILDVQVWPGKILVTVGSTCFVFPVGGQSATGPAVGADAGRRGPGGERNSDMTLVAEPAIEALQQLVSTPADSFTSDGIFVPNSEEDIEALKERVLELDRAAGSTGSEERRAGVR